MNVYLPNLRLPSEYQEVDYIQSSWTQYINTWVINKWSTLNIDIKFMLTYIQSWVEDWIFWGKYSSSNYQAPTLFINKDTSWLWSWAGSWMGVDMLTPASTNTLYNCNVTYTTTTRTWTLNWSSWTSNTWVSNSANNWNWYLSVFADWSWPMSYAYMRLYSFKITVNWTLVRNFVPCYRKSDSVIWLYDLVNNQFYTNSWTGTFSKGNDVTMTVLQNAYIGQYS